MKKSNCDDKVELEHKPENEQSKRLVRMLNQLFESCQEQSTPEVTSQLLNEIRKSFQECFKIEETYMQRTHDPDLSIHREQHRLFIENITCYWQETTKKHGPISIEFCNYLLEWMKFHGRNMDSKFHAF